MHHQDRRRADPPGADQPLRHARDAMPGGGVLSIRTQNLVVGDDEIDYTVSGTQTFDLVTIVTGGVLIIPQGTTLIGKDGNAVRNSILWNDLRSCIEAEEIFHCAAAIKLFDEPETIKEVTYYDYWLFYLMPQRRQKDLSKPLCRIKIKKLLRLPTTLQPLNPLLPFAEAD
jgi:hypothetical protein